MGHIIMSKATRRKAKHKFARKLLRDTQKDIAARRPYGGTNATHGSPLYLYPKFVDEMTRRRAEAAVDAVIRLRSERGIPVG